MDNQKKDIAVIGMAIKYPEVEDVYDFWDMMSQGLTTVEQFPDERIEDLKASCLFSEAVGNSGIMLRKGSYLKDIDRFDHTLFKIPLYEAIAIEPAQRLLLETAWQAAENTGYRMMHFSDKPTGVYIGMRLNSSFYSEEVYRYMPELLNRYPTGQTPAFCANRISYTFNLHGPSMVIDTACSSALVALHTACRAICNGDCSYAFVGGATILFNPVIQERGLGIESDGERTRTFDDAADGTVEGEGVAVLILKGLEEAVNDKDYIHAIIKGSAVSQDGKTIGITSPNANSQAQAIIGAWHDSGVEPRSISYIEAHGTGTKIGDPVEILGITRAFEKYTKDRQFCAISSLKSNIGHTNALAGLSGVIKAILSLKNRKLLPTINFEFPNKRINFQNSPVYICDQLTEWESDSPRRCGVSSFGIGGTNCHMILEEYIQEGELEEEKKWNLLVLSARSNNSLYEYCRRVIQMLRREKVSLTNFCYSINTGREQYEYRLGILACSIEDMLIKLIGIVSKEPWVDKHPDIFMQGKGENIEESAEMKSAGLDIDRLEDMKQIAWAFISGEIIDFDLLYLNKEYQRVMLPPVPMERVRCWPDSNATIFHKKSAALTGNKLLWQQSNRNDIISDFRKIIVISSCQEAAKDLEAVLKKDNFSPLLFYREKYQDSDVCYKEAISRIVKEERCKVVYLAEDNNKPVLSLEDLNQRIKKQIMNFALFLTYLADVAKATKIELVVITTEVQCISEREKCKEPLHAMLYAAGKAAIWEYAYLNIRYVDRDTGTLWKDIEREVLGTSKQFAVAYRNGIRYVETLRNIDLKKSADCGFSIIDNSVYLITGGLGGIGLKILEYLSIHQGVSVILTSRGEFPNHSKWRLIAEEGATEWSEETVLKVKKLVALEKKGIKIDVVTSNVSDEAEVIKLIEYIKSNYGYINGIFHCAGISRYLLLESHNLNDIYSDISAKVHGTWLLNQYAGLVLKGFCLLFSSAVSAVGGFGTTGYGSANAYQKYYADSVPAGNILTICWPEWLDTGMAAGKEQHKEDKQIFAPLDQNEAIDYMEQILKIGKSGIIPGKLNRQSKVMKLVEFYPFEVEEVIEKNVMGGGENRRFDTMKKNGMEMEALDIQDELIEYIQVLLGETLVLPEANLVELGIDSIVGLDLIRHVEAVWGVSIDVGDLYSGDLTVQGIVRRIQQQKKIFDKVEKNGHVEAHPQGSGLLTPAQRQMYRANALTMNSNAYIMIEALEGKGKLDINALKAAFNKVVHRHEALRTTFHIEGGQIIQKVHETVTVQIDIRNMQQESLEVVKDLINSYDYSMPLTAVPLLKVLLILWVDRYYLCYSMPHLITDGISRGIFIQDLVRLYHGNELPEVQLTPLEYANWYNSYLHNLNDKYGSEYWNCIIKKYKNLILFPSEDYTMNNKITSGISKSVQLSSGCFQTIQKYARMSCGTPFTVLLAIYCCFLYLVTRQNEFVVGVPISGRNHPESEAIFGLLAYTLPVYINFSETNTFTELIDIIKNIWTEAYRYQDAWMQKQYWEEISGNKLYNTLFVFQNNVIQEIDSECLNIRPIGVSEVGSKTDLELEIYMKEESYHINFRYSKERFSESTLKYFIYQFQELAENMNKYHALTMEQIRHEINKEIEDTENVVDINFNF